METTAKKQRRHIDVLHFENKLHLNELAFYKHEIELFRHRLEEVASKNTKEEVRARVEQFQNQFIRQLEVNDQLRHKINAGEKALAEYAAEHTVATNRVLFADDNEALEEMKRYKELYNEMKAGFIRFISEWM